MHRNKVPKRPETPSAMQRDTAATRQRLLCASAILIVVIACTPAFTSKGEPSEADASVAKRSTKDGDTYGAPKTSATGDSISHPTGARQGSGGAAAASVTRGTAGGQGNGGAAPSTAMDASIPNDAAADAPPSCDPNASPTTEPCLVDDKYAVFVRQGAVGPGTKAEPTGSISDALVIAKQARLPRVIVCNGTYPEPVAIDDMQTEIAIYGGFACDSNDGGAAWTYVAGERPVIAPASGPSLAITGTSRKVIISDIDFRAPDAMTGSSSISGTIVRSTDVLLLRVGIAAGAGGVGPAGAAGDAGARGWDPSLGVPALPPTCANAPSSQRGGYWSSPSECGSIGGTGGTAMLGSVGGDGGPGQPMQGITHPNFQNGGKGGTNLKQPAPPGANGLSGTNGQLGTAAAAAGAFTAVSYVPADGNAGTDGHTGQGGGGGGANRSTATCLAGGGDAGGMGGCGGHLGRGGLGGGASVALITWDSSVVLQDVSLRSAKGGDGGNGGDGGAGGVGRSGTAPAPTSGLSVEPGGRGGQGGNGGNGGSGSAGTGGPSIALVFHGSAPTEVGQTTLTAAAGGAGGKGGAIGVDRVNPAPDGTPGMSTLRFEVAP